MDNKDVVERSLFDFSDDELLSVVKNGAYPDGTTLVGMEDSPAYDRLWKLRANPGKLAEAVLRERTKQGAGVLEHMGIKERRLALHEEQIKLKKEKLHRVRQLEERIFNKLLVIEEMLCDLTEEVQNVQRRGTCRCHGTDACPKESQVKEEGACDPGTESTGEAQPGV